jgi:hypothetical protein
MSKFGIFSENQKIQNGHIYKFHAPKSKNPEVLLFFLYLLFYLFIL